MNGMKIIVFSDSHGSYEKMRKIACSYGDTLNYIIHLGDLVRDAKSLYASFVNNNPGCKIEFAYVFGNCDFSISINDYEKELIICEKRFLIMHGHTRRVKQSLETLKNLAVQKKYDMILYGHTHIANEICHNGTYILNPGSIEEPRDGYLGSYAVIDIINGIIQTDIKRI